MGQIRLALLLLGTFVFGMGVMGLLAQRTINIVNQFSVEMDIVRDQSLVSLVVDGEIDGIVQFLESSVCSNRNELVRLHQEGYWPIGLPESDFIKSTESYAEKCVGPQPTVS